MGSSRVSIVAGARVADPSPRSLPTPGSSTTNESSTTSTTNRRWCPPARCAGSTSSTAASNNSKSNSAAASTTTRRSGSVTDMVSDDRALGGRTDPRLVADLIRLTVAVGIILCCFVVATPRNGGPDETSHTVYSAALVRGDALRASNGFGVFLVPEMVGRPSTECWALQSFVPADCASLGSSSTDLAPASTLAADYAPYAYLLPGLASFVPSPAAYMYLARLLMASIPFLLVVSGLARLRRHAGPGAFAAALLGLTPIAWFSMSIVNPSAVAIAGGFALWVALLTPADRRADMLLVAAWACVLLPRRDGPLWATLIVLAVCLAGRRRPREIWDGLRHWARWAVGILAAVPVVTTVAMGADELEVVLALAPLSLLAVPALDVPRALRRIADRRRHRRVDARHRRVPTRRHRGLGGSVGGEQDRRTPAPAGGGPQLARRPGADLRGGAVLGRGRWARRRCTTGESASGAHRSGLDRRDDLSRMGPRTRPGFRHRELLAGPVLGAVHRRAAPAPRRSLPPRRRRIIESGRHVRPAARRRCLVHLERRVPRGPATLGCGSGRVVVAVGMGHVGGASTPVAARPRARCCHRTARRSGSPIEVVGLAGPFARRRARRAPRAVANRPVPSRHAGHATRVHDSVGAPVSTGDRAQRGRRRSTAHVALGSRLPIPRRARRRCVVRDDGGDQLRPLRVQLRLGHLSAVSVLRRFRDRHGDSSGHQLLQRALRARAPAGGAAVAAACSVGHRHRCGGAGSGLRAARPLPHAAPQPGGLLGGGLVRARREPRSEPKARRSPPGSAAGGAGRRTGVGCPGNTSPRRQ